MRLPDAIRMPAAQSLHGMSVVDVLSGLVLTVLALYGTAVLDSEGGLIGILTIPSATLPVLWRRRAPLAASVALSVGIVVSAVPTFHQWRCGVAIPALLLVAYSLGRHADRRAATSGLAALLAAMVFLAFTDPNVTPDTVILLVPLCAGIWGTGRLVASRARAATLLRERSDALVSQRAQTAKLAVEIERTRLTSELDGAVRDSVGEMVQLAAQGETSLAGDPAAARRAFARIEAAGRTSLDEMRGLLGALRSDEQAAREPRPTLAQLDRLLAEVRAGGRVIDLDVAGDRAPLSDGVELAAYRIVEHALAAVNGANDVGHHIDVRLRFARDMLEVEIEGARGEPTWLDERRVLAAREQATARGGSVVVRAAGTDRALLRARLPLVAGHA